MPRKPSGYDTSSPGRRVREPRAEFRDKIQKMLISPSDADALTDRRPDARHDQRENGGACPPAPVETEGMPHRETGCGGRDASDHGYQSPAADQVDQPPDGGCVSDGKKEDSEQAHERNQLQSMRQLETCEGHAAVLGERPGDDLLLGVGNGKGVAFQVSRKSEEKGDHCRDMNRAKWDRDYCGQRQAFRLDSQRQDGGQEGKIVCEPQDSLAGRADLAIEGSRAISGQDFTKRGHLHYIEEDDQIAGEGRHGIARHGDQAEGADGRGRRNQRKGEQQAPVDAAGHHRFLSEELHKIEERLVEGRTLPSLESGSQLPLDPDEQPTQRRPADQAGPDQQGKAKLPPSAHRPPSWAANWSRVRHSAKSRAAWMHPWRIA